MGKAVVACAERSAHGDQHSLFPVVKVDQSTTGSLSSESAWNIVVGKAVGFHVELDELSLVGSVMHAVGRAVVRPTAHPVCFSRLWDAHACATSQTEGWRILDGDVLPGLSALGVRPYCSIAAGAPAEELWYWPPNKKSRSMLSLHKAPIATCGTLSGTVCVWRVMFSSDRFTYRRPGSVSQPR